MKPALLFLLAGCALAQNRAILAVGAHCGDAELTAGAVPAKHARLGDRVAILHLTLGEGGNSARSRESAGRRVDLRPTAPQ